MGRPGKKIKGGGLQMCQFSSQRGGLLCRAAAMSLYICQHADASRRRKADRDKPLNLSQVRAVIHCVECRRPRCIFSARRPSSSDRAALEAFVANATYTCGDALSMDTFIVRKNLSCTDPVEAFYFLCCRSRGGICVWCALSFDAERVATSHMLTKQLSMFRGAKNRCQYVQLAMTLALCQVWRRQHPITAHLRPGLTIPRTPGKTERERHMDVRLCGPVVTCL